MCVTTLYFMKHFNVVFFKLLIKTNKIHTATQPLYAIDGMTFIMLRFKCSQTRMN